MEKENSRSPRNTVSLENIIETIMIVQDQEPEKENERVESVFINDQETNSENLISTIQEEKLAVHG